LDNVGKIINDPKFNFTETSIKGQNFAASKLCCWAINIVKYNKIFREVTPLVEASRAAEELSD